MLEMVSRVQKDFGSKVDELVVIVDDRQLLHLVGRQQRERLFLGHFVHRRRGGERELRGAVDVAQNGSEALVSFLHDLRRERVACRRVMKLLR